MAEQVPPNNPQSSDEIDLGQLFKMIGNGFMAVFRGFLRFFLYLKTNFVKLAILVFVGFAIGFALKFIILDELKTEVIVKPNFDSKDYLYNVVEEIESNLKMKDTTFFRELGIVVSELKSLRIEIEPIQEIEEEEDLENDMKYLEILQNFQDNGFVLDAVKSEIQKKSNMNHRITFFYKNILAGRAATLKLMEYVENNSYFNEIKKVYNENSQSKIERNRELIQQIDSLISGYAKNLSKQRSLDKGTMIVDNEKGLDITGILALKNSLIKEIEIKKLELVEQKEVVKVINFGKTQKVKVPIYAQGVAIIPLILLFFFFLYSSIRFLNRKADEMDI
ncbi:MAG: hypothetical protein WBG48_17455 [Pricia sp.]